MAGGSGTGRGSRSLARGVCRDRLGVLEARHLAPVAGEQLVRALGDPPGRVGVGGPAVRRVVLEAAIARGVVRRGDDDAVGESRAGRAQARVGATAPLATRIARDTAGVGVKPSRASMRTSTPAAANTSTAVSCAGPDSAWVSLPMNNGPSMPWLRRYSTIAAVVATICASLKAVSSDGAAVARRAEHHPLVRDCVDLEPGRSRPPDRASTSIRSSGRATVPARSCMAQVLHLARDHAVPVWSRSSHVGVKEGSSFAPEPG